MTAIWKFNGRALDHNPEQTSDTGWRDRRPMRALWVKDGPPVVQMTTAPRLYREFALAYLPASDLDYMISLFYLPSFTFADEIPVTKTCIFDPDSFPRSPKRCEGADTFYDVSGLRLIALS